MWLFGANGERDVEMWQNKRRIDDFFDRIADFCEKERMGKDIAAEVMMCWDVTGERNI